MKRLRDEVELGVGKIKKLEVEKVRLQDEVFALGRKNEQLAEKVKWFEGVGVRGESGERSGLCKVMVENEILKRGKRVAEEEVKGLKEKVAEQEARVAQLDEDGVLRNGAELWELNGMKKFDNVVQPAPFTTEDGLPGILDLTTPNPVTPYTSRANMSWKGKSDSLDELATGRKFVYNRERSSSPIASPGIPAMVNSSALEIIDIIDSEEGENTTRKTILIQAAVNDVPFNVFSNDDKEVFVGDSLKRLFVESSSDEQANRLEESVTPKRRRVSNIVASDSESDDIPIGMPLKKNIAKQDQKSGSEDEVDMIVTDAVQTSIPQRRQRLMSLSQRCEVSNSTGRRRALQGNPSKYEREVQCTTGNVSDDGLALEDTELESEGESLGGFIVNTSDSSSGYSSAYDHCSDINNGSVASHLYPDSVMEYSEIMSKLRRDKDHKTEWESEGDMLSAFGKDSELCLKAVCALYRQQTSDEKQCMRTIHTNGRGFNHLDSVRGSEIATFLTDGDPYGPVTKSIEELEKFYPNGVEVCRDLAKRYSKQLFAIFQSKEDPLFLPEP